MRNEYQNRNILNKITLFIDKCSGNKHKCYVNKLILTKAMIKQDYAFEILRNSEICN